MSTISKLHSKQNLVIIFALLLVMAAVPGTTRAQDSDEFVIGEISNVPSGTTNTTNGIVYSRQATTRERLAELGYVEGENVTYVFNPELSFGPDLITAAEEILAADPDLIIAYGGSAAGAMKSVAAAAGNSTPIVFVGATDPLENGLVTTLQNTEGNLTGVAALSEVYGKQLEWLLLIDPSIERVYVPRNGAFISPIDETAAAAIQEYGESIGVEIVVEDLATPEDQEAAAADLTDKDVDAIMLVPSMGASAVFVPASIEQGIPLTAAFPNNMDAGPLLSYNYTEEIAGTQGARYIDRVLRGAAPNSMPVELVPYSLVINLKTADAMGITISDDILLQADILVR